MTKIEYYEDERLPEFTGWYINDYDKIGEAPIERTGPYATRLKALEMWRASTPDTRTPDKKEPSDARY